MTTCMVKMGCMTLDVVPFGGHSAWFRALRDDMAGLQGTASASQVAPRMGTDVGTDPRTYGDRG